MQSQTLTHEWKVYWQGKTWHMVYKWKLQITNAHTIWYSNSSRNLFYKYGHMCKIIYTHIYNTIFIETSFVIAKVWKQPKCPSVRGLVKYIKVHTFHGIKYTTTTKKKLSSLMNQYKIIKVKQVKQKSKHRTMYIRN